MGHCTSSQKPRLSKPFRSSRESGTATTRGSINKFEPAFAQLNVSERLPHEGVTWWLSSCVIPGWTPDDTKECQDVCFKIKTGPVTLLGVFDGHGLHGFEVADFCKRTLQEHLFEFPSDPADVENYLAGLIRHCDLQANAFWSKVDAMWSGCTAALVAITGNSVVTANVGDSKIVVATRTSDSLEAIQLSVDHVLTDDRERQRIEDAGGIVSQMKDEVGSYGPLRAWHGSYQDVGLAMSRSIGDSMLTRVGVTATADTSHFSITESTEFLIIASDGIWDVMTGQEAVDFVEANRMECPRGSDVPDSSRSAPFISYKLCQEARYRWESKGTDRHIDDISCTVIEIPPATLF